MSGPEYLLEKEDNWITSIGLVFPGERVVFRGKDLFHDLKNLSWMELYLYGITGRFFSENQIRLFESIWTISTSYPDPRIWNNRIAALAGTTRSTATLGICAGIAASEATIYGHRPILLSFDFLLRAKNKLDQGIELLDVIKNELKKYRNIYGYGRPVVNKDERIDPLIRLARKLNLGDGAYVKLAFEVEDLLQKQRWRMKMNVAALAAALVADQGFSSREYYHYLVPCFLAGMFPCYIDTANKREGVFLPLRCSRISYEGKPHRRWS